MKSALTLFLWGAYIRGGLVFGGNFVLVSRGLTFEGLIVGGLIFEASLLRYYKNMNCNCNYRQLF